MKRRASQDTRTPAHTRSHVVTFPAPVAGLNTRDSKANMDVKDALVLENFFPNASDVVLRKGTTNWATGFAKRVKSLLQYSSPIANELYGATDDGIFNATAGGAIGSTVMALTNGYCQSINFTTTGGNFLEVVNGVDKLKLYDGTTWATIDDVSSPAITGVVTSDLIHINAFKNRIWFVQKNTMDAWYLPSASIAGAATKFPLGGIFTRGGFLMAMGTWTIDGGAGIDDLAVFITSEGELAIYQGTDPASPSTFALQGVYYIGAPIGRRCFTKYGGDLLYLSKQGLYPLSSALQSASVDRSVALSSKIDPTFNELAALHSGNPGWEITVFPSAAHLIVNVPEFIGTKSSQYVMNTLTGAWCQYTKWPAACFIVWQDRLFYGTETAVVEAWTGTSDNGASIVGKAQTAFNYLGSNSGIKHVKMLRPVMAAAGEMSIDIGVYTDYDTSVDTSFSQFGEPIGDLWDTGLWDTAKWGGGLRVFKEWVTVAAPEGYAISIYFQVATKESEIHWNTTDVSYQSGGVI